MIGGECAGAVTFLELGQVLATLDKEEDVQWLSDKRFSGVRLVESIVTLIEQRCALTIQRLTNLGAFDGNGE